MRCVEELELTNDYDKTRTRNINSSLLVALNVYHYFALAQNVHFNNQG